LTISSLLNFQLSVGYIFSLESTVAGLYPLGQV